MRKLEFKKAYRSTGSVCGQLSNLANYRDAIYYQNKGRTDSLISTFNYHFDVVDLEDVDFEDGHVYCFQSKSNKFVEIETLEELNEKFTNITDACINIETRKTETEKYLSQYNFEDYKKAARKFIEDTKNWGGLDEYKWYIAVSDEWRESCDNEEGGLSLKRLFHKFDITDEEIKEYFDFEIENLRYFLNYNY